jgi:hypothetical protein
MHKMKPFHPNAKQTLKSYYQVPVEILEDADELCERAKTAIDWQRESSGERCYRLGVFFGGTL